MRVPIALAVAGVLLLVGCSNSEDATSPPPNRAVVVVSGGGATTPFTTPTQACSSDEGYLSAGNTATGLRDYLLAQGKQVYTAPAMLTWGTVQESKPGEFGPFKSCPIVLPEDVTIMSTGDINAGGERLARFLEYLNSQYGVTDVDLVGHSNGGLWSRAAIWVLKKTGSPITVKSLTTLGTPHEGSVPAGYQYGEFSLKDCMGNAFCESFNKGWVPYAGKADKGLNKEDTPAFLNGPDGWNVNQGNVLDGIPVTLMAGTIFRAKGGPAAMWPYDGLVSRYSAWAPTVPDAVIAHRTCWAAALTHSIFISDAAKLDWQTALTWNTDALARVDQAIDEADSALGQPNRQGCPG